MFFSQQVLFYVQASEVVTKCGRDSFLVFKLDALVIPDSRDAIPNSSSRSDCVEEFCVFVSLNDLVHS